MNCHSTSINFLGLTLDSLAMEACLPQEKLTYLCDVVCSYTGCWEVVVNQLTYIELLLLGGYFGRTFDSVGPHFTEVWIASC